ncbi:MAG: hypothetical protein AAF629_22275 [Chloroflexota bacterium]
MSQWFLVCAWCKEWARKPDDVNWYPIKKADAEKLKSASVSHGICPSCSEAFFNKDDLSSESDELDQHRYANLRV